MNHDDRPNASIWGAILSCVEVGINIYQIATADKKGLMIPTDNAKKLLSEKTIDLGETADGYVHFEENSVAEAAAAYELVREGHITDPVALDHFGRPERLEAKAQLFLPEQFGALPNLEEIPSEWGETKSIIPIDNGFFLFKCEEGSGVAVADVMADYFLSDYAMDIFIRHTDGHRFYELNAGAAIIIFELSSSHPKVLDMITSWESLMSSISANYPDYTSYWNNHVDADAMIVDTKAPIYMFLQEHLDDAAAISTIEFSPEYGEVDQTDDFFEHSIPYDELEI